MSLSETLSSMCGIACLIFWRVAEKMGFYQRDSKPDAGEDAKDTKSAKARCSTQPNNKMSTEDILKEIKLQKDIILRTRNPYTGKSCSPQAQLEARTLPNARLRSTFGVNNAFTTREMKTAGAFKALAKSLLRNATHIQINVDEIGKPAGNDTDADWERIISEIQKVVREETTTGNEIMNLAEVVQYITLRISMHVLFGTNVKTWEDREAVKYIAKTVNILWIQSKNKSTTDETNWAHERRLHQHLFNLTKLEPTNNLLNPMNLILPAYETMWRAVLRGVLEIYFREHPNSQQWQETLRAFISIPQRNMFHRFNATDKICPVDIVKEILRMYPPTRRVHRWFPDDEERVTRSANIEKLHRNALLVPAGDAEVFRPERWLDIKNDFKAVQAERENVLRKEKPSATYMLREYEEELGYMPFALSCPAGGKATQGFGFKMIALLVIVIIDGLDSLNSKFTGSDATPSVQSEVAVVENENLYNAPATKTEVLISVEDVKDEPSTPTPTPKSDESGTTPLTLEALRQLEKEHPSEVKDKETVDNLIKAHVDDYLKAKDEKSTPNADTPNSAADPVNTVAAHMQGPMIGDRPPKNLPLDAFQDEEYTLNIEREKCPAQIIVPVPRSEPEPESASEHAPTPPPISKAKPRRQVWKLEAEVPSDEMPEIGRALGSERADYLSLVYRWVV